MGDKKIKSDYSWLWGLALTYLVGVLVLSFAAHINGAHQRQGRGIITEKISHPANLGLAVGFAGRVPVLTDTGSPKREELRIDVLGRTIPVRVSEEEFEALSVGDSVEIVYDDTTFKIWALNGKPRY